MAPLGQTEPNGSTGRNFTSDRSLWSQLPRSCHLGLPQMWARSVNTPRYRIKWDSTKHRYSATPLFLVSQVWDPNHTKKGYFTCPRNIEVYSRRTAPVCFKILITCIAAKQRVQIKFVIPGCSIGFLDETCENSLSRHNDIMNGEKDWINILTSTNDAIGGRRVLVFHFRRACRSRNHKSSPEVEAWQDLQFV